MINLQKNTVQNTVQNNEINGLTKTLKSISIDNSTVPNAVFVERNVKNLLPCYQ